MSQQLQGNIKTYTRNDSNDIAAVDVCLQAGDVIVATNLAGRGTDLKTSSEVEKNNGLHVCLTFVPNNLRVQEQAFGRTSRQGLSGSGQMILNIDLQILHNINQDIFEQRDHLEKFQLKDQFEGQLFKNLRIKDEFFSKFCKFLQQIRNNERYDTDIISQTKLKYKILSIEERWGLWLKQRRQLNDQNQEAEFEAFLNKLNQDYRDNNLLQNIAYSIQEGNEFLLLSQKSSKKSDLIQAAHESYDASIQKDPDFAHFAYYGRAFARIKYDNPNFEYKEIVIQDLQKCSSIINEKIMPFLFIMQFISSNCNFKTPFDESIFNKITIYQMLLDSINDNVEQIKKSQKLVELCFRDKQIIGPIYRIKSEISNLEQVKYFDLRFNGFISIRDLTVQNKLLEAINEVPTEKKICIKFKDLTITKAHQMLPFCIFHDIKFNDEHQKEEEDQEYSALNQLKNSVNIVGKIGKGYFKTCFQKISSVFKKSDLQKASNISLNVIFHDLTQQQSLEILKNFQAEDQIVEVDIFFSDIDLKQKLINSRLDQYHKTQIWSYEALRFIENVENLILNDIYQDMPQEGREEDLEGLRVEIKFIKLSQKDFFYRFEKIKIDSPMSIQFDELDKNLAQFLAKVLIEINEEISEDAELSILELTHEEAQALINTIEPIRDEKHLKCDIKYLENLFLQQNELQIEINDLKNNGLIGKYEVYGIPPLLYKSALTVGLIGVGQIALGAVISVISNGVAGAQGGKLISEGISDIIYAIKGLVPRKNWFLSHFAHH